MTVIRDKTISTHMTPLEFAKCKEAAGERSVSDWSRNILLEALHPDPMPAALLGSLRVVLEETIAVRLLLVNLSTMDPATFDMLSLRQWVDAEKKKEAAEKLR